MPNGGKIEYSLGLATAGFLGPLGAVAGRLSAFIGVSAAAGTAIAGVWKQIQRGGELTDLANRTGESVKDLYQLQYAFEQSGIAAEGVAPILQRYRQSLSGIGESGENTADAFAAIGTSIQELKGLDAPAALEKIFKGLAAVDRNTAAGVAGTLFGRGGAGSILQVARDGDSFAEALKESADQAERMQRLAPLFDKIGDTLVSLKRQLDGVFLGLAEEVGPAINGVLQSLAKRDFATLGKIAELSLTVGFESAVNTLARALQAVFAALPEMMKAGLKGGAALGDVMAASLFDASSIALTSLGGAAPVGSPLREFLNQKSALSGQIADELRAGTPQLLSDAFQSVMASIKAGLTADTKNLFGGENAAALAAILQSFGPVAGKLPLPGGIAPNALTSGFSASSLSQANALERVGAIFGGGSGSGMTEYSRETARNTREANKVLREIQKAVEHWDGEANLRNI